jgi:hypothetical protein
MTAPFDAIFNTLIHTFDVLAAALLKYINIRLKAKAVPLHAMKALGRRGGIGPTHS